MYGTGVENLAVGLTMARGGGIAAWGQWRTHYGNPNLRNQFIGCSVLEGLRAEHQETVLGSQGFGDPLQFDGHVFAIAGAALTSELLIGLDWRVLIANLIESHLLDEFLMGIVKATCFGISISCISCYYGMNVRGGAVGVGRAVNDSVVASAAGIFVLDYFVGYLYSL